MVPAQLVVCGQCACPTVRMPCSSGSQTQGTAAAPSGGRAGQELPRTLHGLMMSPIWFGKCDLRCAGAEMPRNELLPRVLRARWASGRVAPRRLQALAPLHIAHTRPSDRQSQHIRSPKCRRRASTSSWRALASVGDADGMPQPPICAMSVSARSSPPPSPLGCCRYAQQRLPPAQGGGRSPQQHC